MSKITFDLILVIDWVFILIFHLDLCCLNCIVELLDEFILITFISKIFLERSTQEIIWHTISA
jgi:hypothetical protein